MSGLFAGEPMLIQKPVADLKLNEEFLVIDPPACHLCRKIDEEVTSFGDITVIDMVTPGRYMVLNQTQQVWVAESGTPMGDLLFPDE